VFVASDLQRTDRDRRRKLLEPVGATERPGHGHERLQCRTAAAFECSKGTNSDVRLFREVCLRLSDEHAERAHLPTNLDLPLIDGSLDNHKNGDYNYNPLQSPDH